MQKTTLFETKSNELSENVSFESEFVVTFVIQQFKGAFFAFLNSPIFKSNSGLNVLRIPF